LRIVNEPNVSGSVVWTYGTIAIFVAALIPLFAYAGFFTPIGVIGFVASIVLAFVEAIILSIVGSLHGTRYVLTDEELLIETSRLIGGNKRIPLETVESVERTLIPFGIRLFGASFHGGYYQVPGLGRAFLAITNFNDGLLVKTRHGNYILTPRNPAAFKEAMKM
jgi:hypothetical protein